jgi:hypothetical protein
VSEKADLKPLGNALAIVEKIQTQRDGGFRITLDLTDTEYGLVSKLLEIKADPTKTPLFYVAFIKKPEDY